MRQRNVSSRFSGEATKPVSSRFLGEATGILVREFPVATSSWRLYPSGADRDHLGGVNRSNKRPFQLLQRRNLARGHLQVGAHSAEHTVDRRRGRASMVREVICDYVCGDLGKDGTVKLTASDRAESRKACAPQVPY
jgi:hypothetical protein